MTLSRSGTRSRPKHRPPVARRYPQTANSGSAMKVTFCVRGVLSPLLSNLVLDDLDKELTRRGLRFCRYAGDCNIYVRSRRAGERVMASVSRFLTNKLKLKVNEAKSAVARPEERKFLGFSIANDGSERRIAPKALAKFKAQIRDMTRRTRGNSLPQVIEDLAPYLLGWRGYFGFCQTPRVLTHLEAWIRRRLRAYLWRQWQNGPNRFKELRQRGLPKFHAAVAAGSPTGFSRRSGHPAVQQALRNPYFDGPPPLCSCPRSTRSNHRGTNPYARWCGRGGAARCPPIPINANEWSRVARPSSIFPARASASGGDISGEGRGHSGEIKGVGKGVGMSQLPAQCERAIGSSGGLIRIAAMPKRQGQLDKGAEPDVLPIAKGGIAMLVGPIQRCGRFDVREGCAVIAAIDQ